MGDTLDTGLQFGVASSEEEFDGLRAEWGGLLEHCPTTTVFNTWEWLRCWWEHYGSDRPLAIVWARRGGALRALFPLWIEREVWKGVIPFRTLRLLGDGSNDSDYLDFLISDEEGERTVEAFWSYLFERSGLRFDLIRICEMPVESPHYRALRALLARRGATVREQRIGAVSSSLPGDWDQFVARLKPRMRTKVRSLRRRLEEAHRLRFSRAETPTDIDAALESLFALHSRRWSRRSESGVFAKSEKRAFYRAMSQRFGASGSLRLFTLEVDGHPAAHEHCVARGDTVYLLQEGYDPVWEEHGVGNVLRAMVLEECIREGFRTYDFLGGVTQHKRSWGGEIKESARFTCRGTSAWGGIYIGLTGASVLLDRLRRRTAPPSGGPVGGSPQEA